MNAKYDKIGRSYRGTRQPDPRIEAQLLKRIGGARQVVNIGAGAGSYEPDNCSLVAVEPSQVMLRQRPSGAAPAVQAVAERLPFKTGSFDLAMSVLSLHHWSDWRKGVAEALRVANGRFVTLTWIGFPNGFWLTDYFPEIYTIDAPQFPSIEEYEDVLGELSVDVVPIARDCIDGFLCAYWCRPEAYLDAQVRNGMSTFSILPNVDAGISRLKDDLSSGRWHDKNRALLEHESYDFGYRIISRRAQAGA